jgi:hypothetical protein
LRKVVPTSTALLRANLALLALNLAHSLDHAINQGDGWAGFGAIGGLGIGVVLVALLLSWLQSRYAAPVTALVGFGQAVAFTLIHLAPHWGPVSAPYYDAENVNALSWIVLAISLGVSLYAGLVGLREWRGSRIVEPIDI